MGLPAGIEIKNFINDRSKQLGFEACGVTKPVISSEDYNRFSEWLKKGNQAGMSYMNRNTRLRECLVCLQEGTKSVVLFLFNYKQENKQLPGAPKIAQYAWGRDYHKVLKKKLNTILKELEIQYGIEGRAFVDSAPVLERQLAFNAGLGWIGKNSCLLTRKGSMFFICELFLSVELPLDNPIEMHCGNCTKCIDACPTNALTEPYVLDSRKCISYLTIEKKEDFDTEEANMLKNHIFGCDICHDVCPWNKKQLFTEEIDFTPRKQILEFDLSDWEAIDQSQF